MSSPDQQPLHYDPNAPGTDLPPKRNKVTGYTICKILVVIYGFFFLLIGVIVLAIAIWIAQLKKDYESINDLLTSPTILAIVAGAFMIIMAFAGLIGALRENLILLKLFLAVIIIVFIMQVIVGILVFHYRNKTSKEANKQLEFALKSYHENKEVERAVDYIQDKFACCGLADASDWEKNENFSCSSFGPNACSVPMSCCDRDFRDENCGSGVRLNSTSLTDMRGQHINSNGCHLKFSSWVVDHFNNLGRPVLGLAIPHIFGIVLVYFFIQKVEDRIYLFKYRQRIYES